MFYLNADILNMIRLRVFLPFRGKLNMAALLIIEPRHEKICLMSYAKNKGADPPAHPQMLYPNFIGYFL